MSRTAARFALLAFVFTAAACDKVALLAPTGSTVTVSVSSTTLGANGSAEVVATVIEAGGTPVHNGTEVRFQTSVGILDPAVAQTDGGVARTMLRANGASGTAKVLAFSGGAKSTEVEVRVGNAAAETIAVRTNPSSVSQLGGTVQVIATVRDVSGSPVPGAQVVFTSDNGALSSGNAIADDQGEARVALTTSRETNVKASVAGKEGTARITVVTLPTASISVSPANPSAGVTVTITVTPGSTTNGNPIRDVTVDFGDGTSQSLGAISSATPTSHVYGRAGDYIITVTTTDTAGQRNQNSLVITVQPAAVSPTVTASPNPVGAGAPVTFTVGVSNPSNVPLTGIRLEFGDGSAGAQFGASGGTATKIYNNTTGSVVTYTATATATDQSGNRYSQSTPVAVQPRAALTVTLDAAVTENTSVFTCSLPATQYPKVCSTTLSAFVPPPGGQPGVRVLFTAAVTAGLLGPVASRYIWDFNGDGVADRETSSATTDFLFTIPGEYVVRVRVAMTDGNFGDQYLTLRISP